MRLMSPRVVLMVVSQVAKSWPQVVVNVKSALDSTPDQKGFTSVIMKFATRYVTAKISSTYAADVLAIRKSPRTGS